MSVPPPIAASAPVRFAHVVKRPKTSTQKNAVSRPPNANILMSHIRDGGATARTKTMIPSTAVTPIERRRSVRSGTNLPRCC